MEKVTIKNPPKDINFILKENGLVNFPWPNPEFSKFNKKTKVWEEYSIYVTDNGKAVLKNLGLV